MNAVKHFLGNYSENFAAALVLWPVLSFMLTLPILAYLYHRDGRLRFGTFVGAYLTVLYVCGLGCFTLYPLPQGDAGLGITYGVAPNFNPMNFMNDIAKDGLKAVFQLAFNVVFFMPLGFIAGRLLRLRFLPSVLLGLAASLLIEVSQLTGLFGIYPYAYRCCDVDDVITNTLGAALGWVCAWLLGRVVPPGQLADAEPTEHPGFVRRCVALWIDLVIVWLVAVVPYGAVAVGFEVAGLSPADVSGYDGESDGRPHHQRPGAHRARRGGSGHPLVPRRIYPGRLVRAHDLRDPSPHDGLPRGVLRGALGHPGARLPMGAVDGDHPAHLLPGEAGNALRPHSVGERLAPCASLLVAARQLGAPPEILDEGLAILALLFSAEGGARTPSRCSAQW